MTYSNATWDDIIVTPGHHAKVPPNRHAGVPRNGSSLLSNISTGGVGYGKKLGSKSSATLSTSSSTAGAAILRRNSSSGRPAALSSLDLRRTGRADSLLHSSEASGGGIRQNLSGVALASAGLGPRRSSGASSGLGGTNKPKRRNSLTSLVSHAAGAVSRASISSASGGRNSAVSLVSLASDASVRTGGSHHHHKNVAHYIERRKWKKALKRIDTAEGREEVRASSTLAHASSEEDSKASIAHAAPAEAAGAGAANTLHRACANAAPFEIVRAICAVCPDLAVEADSRGRTALHLAASRPETTRDVVEYLLCFNGGAAYARDDGGRPPLHAACRRYVEDDATSAAGAEPAPPRRRFSGGHIGSVVNSSKPPRKVSLPVIQALCKSAPFAIHDEDTEEGLIPAEHALRYIGGGGKPCDVPTLAYLLKESRLRWVLRIDKEGGLAEAERERWTARRTEAMRAATDAAERAERREERERELMDDAMGDLLGVTLAPRQRPAMKGEGGCIAPNRVRLRRGMPHELMCELNTSNSSISVLGIFEETLEAEQDAHGFLAAKAGEE
mmetsp:Transcript_7652/g.22436  ORF Transcript_7652/g.22436 Transcript_7652/m.22436 type:complete len:559 (-) Transcript_7652:99-1775(-)